MAMAQTDYQAGRAFRCISAATAKRAHREETPLFQALLHPSSMKVTDGLCIKDATTLEEMRLAWINIAGHYEPPFLEVENLDGKIGDGVIVDAR